MKIAATLAAFVSAGSDWNGQSIYATCGSIVDVTMTGDSNINATCTVTSSGSVNFISVGTAFWTSDTEFSSFVDMNSTANVLVFYSQSTNIDGSLDNSTCGSWEDISVDCSDNGAENGQSNLVGNFAFAPDNNSFQVPVANPTSDFAVDLSAFGGHANHTCNGSAMTVSGDSLTCAFGDGGDLGYFGFNSDSRPDMPNSHFA